MRRLVAVSTAVLAATSMFFTPAQAARPSDPAYVKLTDAAGDHRDNGEVKNPQSKQADIRNIKVRVTKKSAVVVEIGLGKVRKKRVSKVKGRKGVKQVIHRSYDVYVGISRGDDYNVAQFTYMDPYYGLGSAKRPIVVGSDNIHDVCKSGTVKFKRKKIVLRYPAKCHSYNFKSGDRLYLSAGSNVHAKMYRKKVSNDVPGGGAIGSDWTSITVGTVS